MHNFHRQEFGVNQVREIVNSHDHLAAVKQRDIAVWNVQDIGLFAVECSVREFQLFLVTVNATDEWNVEPATATTSASVWVQIQFASGLTLDEAIKVYTDILEADTTLGFTAKLPTETCTMSSGDEGRHAIYVTDGFSVELYAFSGRVQISIAEYSDAPESAWADAVLAIFQAAGYSLSWDSDSQSYQYANLRPLGEGETINDVCAAFSAALLADLSLNLDTLVDTGSRDTNETTVLLYCDEGAISILLSNYYGYDYPVLFITVSFFDDEIPLMVNAIGAVMSANMSLYQTGVYAGMARFGLANKYKLSEQGATVLDNYVGALLLDAEALGFAKVAQNSGYDADSGYYIGIYTNDDGWMVQIILIPDDDGNYSNYYQVIVIEPAE